jgi:hypothetical protein
MRFYPMNKALFALFLLLCSARPLVAAELTLTFGNGLVTVDAKDVTVRQILTEWARVGKTRIVNMERVASPPVTIKIERIPEKQALEIILRAVPGYMAAPRPAPLQGASAYDRILIIASTSVAPAPARLPATTSLQGAVPPSQLRVASPALNPGALPDLSTLEDDNEAAEEEAAARAAAAAGLLAVPAVPPNMFQPGVNVVPGVGTLRAPVGLQEPQAAPTTPAPTPTNPWNAPVGSAMPGPPTPTPQPNQQGRPLVPLRPPPPDR